MVLELPPLLTCRGPHLAFGSQVASAFDERPVGCDDVFGEHGGVAPGGFKVQVSEQAGGDVQG